MCAMLVAVMCSHGLAYLDASSGGSADIWRRVGVAIGDRDLESSVARWIYLHLAADDVVAGRAPCRIAAGNAATDALAGMAAQAARVSELDRHRMRRVEAEAHQVRFTLVRATMDAVDAEAELAKLQGPRGD
ncbi:unnamed protein product, partial [Prorocentrum cordatum]